MYQNFIGIDISKLTFVVGFHNRRETYEFNNTTKGFKAFFKKFKAQLSQSLVVLETTGGYEMELINFLLEAKVALHRADTRKVKYFIRSLGREAKSDAIDALGLAQYGYERHERLDLFVPKTTQQDLLQQFTERRLDLKKMLVQEKNRSQSPNLNPSIRKSCHTMIKTFERQIQTVDEALQSLIEAEPEQREKQQVLQEIDGIGQVLSTTLIALLPELGTVNRRRIASLVGLAPHPCESGAKIGYRRTKGGREDVRSILFMAAMTASQSKGRLGEFYRHLIAQGKKKMVALTALMRKIVVIANAKLADWYNKQQPVAA